MTRLLATWLWLGVLAAGSAARAEEGMWTFDEVPEARLERTLGLHPDRAWFDHLRLSSLRLTNGCTAALVSRAGLALTSEHCLIGCVQALSRPGVDYVADGFLTDRREEERACPGLQAEVLVGIDDVTAKVMGASHGKAGEAYVLAREDAINEAERRDCGGDARLRCQVISFFAGGQFKLYKFRRYDDVRLVFAPEFAVAYFGGDADNFSFPRFDLDCAFVRLYEDGRPAVTPAALSWSREAPKAGEAVFVAGNPGVTERNATVAQLETERDVLLPSAEAAHAGLRAALAGFAGTGAEARRLAAARLFEEENAAKLIRGRLAVLGDDAFMASRRADEEALRAKVKAEPKLAAAVGDPWAVVAAAQKSGAALYGPWRVLESEPGAGSQLYQWARAIVRGAEERSRPAAQRLPEFAPSRLPLVEKAVLDDRATSPDLERLLLAWWLASAREALGVQSAAAATLLAGNTPQALAQRLAASGLYDPKLRLQLWRGGLAAVAASDDPMIVFVRDVDPLARAARQAWEDDYLSPMQRADVALAFARLGAGESDLYPDATFSLRLSWGRVEGLDAGPAKLAPFTTLAQLYDHASASEPYRLSPRWIAARDRLAGATVFDFVTTNDIIGGNSGSAVVDAHGRIVGSAFDGNAASIAGDFVYDGTRNRTVAVSTAAIGEALAQVYGRTALLAELTGG